MTIKLDQQGNAHHVSVPMLSNAGYVPDPLHVLRELHGGNPAWWYTIDYNPANWKPEVFEGYPNVHTLIHEPWSY